MARAESWITLMSGWVPGLNSAIRNREPVPM
jgi:hypothetical protein